MSFRSKMKAFKTLKRKSSVAKTSNHSDGHGSSPPGPSRSQKSSSSTPTKISPRTPSPGRAGPVGTAKYSPHFSRKKRKKLFKDLPTATENAEDSPLAESCGKNTIVDFFSRAKPQKFVSCPVCQEQVPFSSINKHLDNGCIETSSMDDDGDFVQNPTKSKMKRAGSLKTKAEGDDTEAAVSSVRKIAEVKTDLKDRRARLRLKRKMESHSLYSSEGSSSGPARTAITSEKANTLTPNSSLTTSCSSSQKVVRSEYFNADESTHQKSEVIKTPSSLRRLSTHSTKSLGLGTPSLEGDMPFRSSQDENNSQSLERKSSNASECSTVILSSQSQEIRECQEDVFMMYSTSSVNCSSQEPLSDIPYDTSPELSRMPSISKSGYLKYDNQRLICTRTSIASDEEDTDSKDGDVTPRSMTPTPVISGTDTSSGIGSESSSSGNADLPHKSQDAPSTSGQISCDDFVVDEGFTPLNWNDDSSQSFTSSQSSQKTQQNVIKLYNRPSNKCEHSESSPPLSDTGITPSNSFSGKSSSLTGSVLENSPLRTTLPGSSQKGTPSKKAAEASSPANSPWKYRDPYFLANFKLIMNTVLANEDDRSLFNSEDTAVIDSFRNLSAPSQQLYVRLFQRKHAWLQVAKLDYKRISRDLTPVVAELHEAGLIQTDVDLTDFEAALNLCATPDLKTLAKTLRLNVSSSGQTKQVLVDALLKHGRQQRSLFAASMEQVLIKKAKKMLGPCIRLRDEPRVIFSRLLLLFSVTSDIDEEDKASGGMSQLQILLLSNMGRVIYPTYQVLRTVKIFATRDDLLRYETALHYENDIATAMSTNDFELAYQLQQTAMLTYEQLQNDPSILDHDVTLPDFIRRFTASWTYTRIMYTGVEILQKLRRYAEAVDLLRQLLAQTNYCQDSRGRWWDRLALNLDQHLKKMEEALDATRDGLADSCVRTGHRLALQLRAQKILKSASNKRLKKRQAEFTFDPVREMPRVTIEGQVLPYQAPGIKNTFVREWTGGKKREGDMAICRVEEIALYHYKEQGYEEGVHGEGSTFTTLTSLLFWDLIFMDGIPDTFCYPYQSAPLDLRFDAFFTNRQEALEQRLSEIREADIEELQNRLQSSWTEYNGEQCVGVSWDLFNDVQHAQSLLACLGGEFLAAVAERILKDHRHCRGGMPDLTVWSPQSGKFKLVEVKGPGDRLSQKQILWIDFFLSQGVDAEVCHVTAVGSKRFRLARASSRSSDVDSASSQN